MLYINAHSAGNIFILQPLSFKSNVPFGKWQSNNKHRTHSKSDCPLCDGAEYLLSHGYVALAVLQVEQMVPDVAGVEALLCKLHLHLLKGPSYCQFFLEEQDKWLNHYMIFPVKCYWV